MISATQNRQQNTAFGAYIVPHPIVKQLKENDVKFTTVKSYAEELWSQKGPLRTAKHLWAAENRPHYTTLDILAGVSGDNKILEEHEIKQLNHQRSFNGRIALLSKFNDDASYATVRFVDGIRASLQSIDMAKAAMAKAIAKTKEDLSKTLGQSE